LAKLRSKKLELNTCYTHKVLDLKVHTLTYIDTFAYGQVLLGEMRYKDKITIEPITERDYDFDLFEKVEGAKSIEKFKGVFK